MIESLHGSIIHPPSIHGPTDLQYKDLCNCMSIFYVLVYLPTHPTIQPFDLSIYLSIHLSIYLSVCPFVYLSVNLPLSRFCMPPNMNNFQNWRTDEESAHLSSSLPLSKSRWTLHRASWASLIGMDGMDVVPTSIREASGFDNHMSKRCPTYVAVRLCVCSCSQFQHQVDSPSWGEKMGMSMAQNDCHPYWIIGKK